MKIRTLLAATAAVALGTVAAQAGTMDDIKARGILKCGVSTGVPGFGFTDDAGNWQGFDPAVCQAVAAAVLGDASKVEFTPTTGKTRFTALASGEIDMLARNTTWTFSRDVDLKFSSPASTTTTVRASWCPRRWASPAPRNWTARRSASRPAPPPS